MVPETALPEHLKRLNKSEKILLVLRQRSVDSNTSLKPKAWWQQLSASGRRR